ncbi:hypothetical protein K3495_g14936 [Podosphaera aphanis]|nr:hypothetical protein K3495_g14936 [Podosphaera aphanis]
MALSEISDLLAFPSLYALTKEKEFSPAYELTYPQAIRPLCGPAVVGNLQVPASQVSTLRSPSRPDPGPLTGEKHELLPAFLKQLQLKLARNDDWWPT